MLVSYTDIIYYVKVSHFQITMSIISNTSLKFVTFSYQQTPLHLAASKGREYTVEWLVKKRANKNIKDKKGVSEKLYL